MGRKKRQKPRHYPEKYKKYKGCFGAKGVYKLGHISKVTFPSVMNIHDDKAMKELLAGINRSLADPDLMANFCGLKSISVDCGLILRAYVDEFRMRHGRSVKVMMPKDDKAKAILSFLSVLPPDDSYLKYKDLKCWSIFEFDCLEEQNVSIPELLKRQVINKIWADHKKDDETNRLASAASEICFNCGEHAYSDESFQKWYIGAGEYPDSNKFSLCFFDRGQGFKKSMERDKASWQGFSVGLNDYKCIEMAVEGKAYKNGNHERGKGIPNALEQIKNVNGGMLIWSGKGLYSSSGRSSRKKKWPVYLKGSLVEFSIPIGKESKVSIEKRQNAK